MKGTVAIILAAGRGTRMKSEVPKVMQAILGKPMVSHILDSLRQAGLADVIIVAGYGEGLLKSRLKDRAKVVVQKDLLGSGDAVNATKTLLKGYAGDILLIYGDTPLIRAETIKGLIDKHKSSGASATILTAEMKDPSGYGRIVRGSGGKISRIVEETEARLYEEVIKEANAGLYCFRSKDLFEALPGIKADNKKREYFLTDAIGILHKKGKSIESVTSTDSSEIIGVNTKTELSQASRLLKDRILEGLMSNGVTIEDPQSTTVYPDVKIGEETIIYPNTVIESNVEVGRSSSIGPFAHLRPGVRIGDRVHIGNFVELVRTSVGDDTRIKHLTYLGDAIVGEDVNIGAGTITANFDGKKKNRTIIEDGASIGVGAIFIAPVKIGKNAIVGAGCVVPKNHDVPRGATVVGVPARILRQKKS